MNLIRSLIPASRLKVSGCPFVLAALLAAPALLGSQKPASSHPVVKLDNSIAAKLLIHVAKPDFPAIAKVNLIQGSVDLQITVNEMGRVIVVHVIEGQPMLAAAAIEAVRKWLYRPYYSSGGPAPFITDVSVKFQLSQRKFKRSVPKDTDGYLEKQIHPPEVASRPGTNPSSASVRFKVLVGPKGEILDAASLEGKEAGVELARENLRRWKFRPARWGAIAVPWYVIVKVPFDSALEDRAAYSAKH